LPSPRPASGSPGPLGSLRPGSLERSPLPSCSSPALRRHLSVFASRSPPGPLRPSSTQEPLAPGASLELLHPSAFPDKTTLLLAPLPGSAPPTVLADEESHPQGLATLSAALSRFYPRKPLSAPNTPGLRPPELSSSRMIDPGFPQSLSALALPTKTSRPPPGAPTASSHPKSRVPLAPGWLPRVGTSCSPGLSRPLGLSLR
jgi:hypothetical protein